MEGITRGAPAARAVNNSINGSYHINRYLLHRPGKDGDTAERKTSSAADDRPGGSMIREERRTTAGRGERRGWMDG